MALNTDIFKSFELVNDLQKKFYEDENENTLVIGTYGAQAEISGSLLQRSLIVASEVSNEAIPTKAKYEKSVIAHAKFSGINEIDAIPAHMQVMMFIPKNKVDSNLVQNKFIIDKDCKFMIEDFEFHLDYDIIITRNRIRTNEYVYTAMYDMGRKNVLSDLDTVNLPPIGIIKNVSGDMLGFTCIIRQVQLITIHKKILTDNSIENKTSDFEFEDQLAAFDIEAVEGDTSYYITPVYDGTIVNTQNKYCEYQFIDINSIRLKFNRDSYLPRINADININIKTTKGSRGNLTYKEQVVIDLKSEKYNYNNITCMINPLTNSTGGIDRKSISELKSIIPKENLSRGSIISTADLDAFFNSTNLENSKLYFYKKKYNQLEHVYYSYMLMKYNDIVVPTNTISIQVNSKDLEMNGKNWLIKPLSTFLYNNEYGVIDENAVESDATPFVYVNPFMIGINKTPLVLSYFLTIFSVQKYLEFSYINQTSTLQFISSSLNMTRSGFSDVNKYKIDISMIQNINSDFKLITKDDTGNITDVSVKVLLLLYNDTTQGIWRYGEAELKSFNSADYSYDFQITMETDNTISSTNLMKITNLKQPVSGEVVDSYIGNGIKGDILILAKTEVFYGNNGFDEVIPGIEGYSLCNRYGIRDGLELFYNYTQMMSSTPIVSGNETDGYTFTIDKVPMIRKAYISTEDRMGSIIKEIQTRRKYIEYCLNILEDGFDIDFKLFNTYGPSKRFTHEDGTFINKVNLSIIFKTKLYSNADKYILEMIKDSIKNTIENIDGILDIHMSNIAEGIRDNFRDQLEFFEFVGFNGYGAGLSHIYQINEDIKNDVPEFLNINTLNNDLPDIQIITN